MGRPRSKPAKDLTTEEALKHLFPKPVAQEAKKEAAKSGNKPQPKSDR